MRAHTLARTHARTRTRTHAISSHVHPRMCVLGEGDALSPPSPSFSGILRRALFSKDGRF